MKKYITLLAIIAFFAFPWNAKSQCVPISSLPYSENFDSLTTSTSTNTGVLPTCWTRMYCYTSVSSGVPQVNYGSTNAHSGNYSFKLNFPSIVALPAVAAPLNTVRLGFYLKQSTSSTNWLIIGVVSDVTDTSTFVPLDTITNTTGYDYHEIFFDGITDTNLHIAFRNKKSNGSVSAAAPNHIDDLTITARPMCMRPTSLSINNIQYNSALLSWDSTASSYLIVYGTDSTMNDSLTSTTNSVALTGLNGSTTYTVQVKSICSATDESGWSNPLTFTTPCNPLTASDIPYADSFEGYGQGESAVINPCWFKGTNGNTQYPMPAPAAAITGSNGMVFYGNVHWSGTQTYSYLSLPLLGSDITLSGLTLRFNVKRPANSSYSFLSIGVMTDPNDITTFTTVDTLDISAAATNTVSTVEVPLNSYTGNGRYVALYAGAPAYDSTATASISNNIYVDDVELINTPTCFRPSSIAASNVEANSATITWVPADSTVTNYLLAYGPNDSTMTTMNVTGTSATLTGLTAETRYYVKVKALCSTTEESEYSRTASFLTLRQVTMVNSTHPYFEGFEGTNDFVLINGELANNWVIGNATSNGGNNSLYISNDNGLSNAYTETSAVVVYASKLIGFSAGSYHISYDWNCNGESTYDYMRVALIPESVELEASTTLPTGLGTTTVPEGCIAMDGGSKLNQSTTWETYSADFTVPATGYYNLVFVWRNDGSVGHNPPAAIDNINITQPSCGTPGNLAANNTTSNSTTLTWTPGSSDQTNFLVAYGTSPSLASMTMVNVTGSSLSLTGLNASTVYYICVQAICSADDSSNWSAMGSFRTSCDALTLPYFCDFEDATPGSYSNDYEDYIPCWTKYNDATSTGSYAAYPYAYSSSSYAHSGSICLYFYQSNSTSYPENQISILPPVNPTVNPANTLRLRFWAKMSSSSYDGTLLVGVMGDPSNVSSFIPVSTINLTTTLTEYSVPLSQYTGNGAYVAIKCPRTDASAYQSIYVDDVTLEELPSCVEPIQVAATNITYSGATISWTPSSTSQTNFIVAYGTSNNISSMATVTSSSNSATLSGLSSGTEYFIKVRGICSGSDTSGWSSDFSFTTSYAVPFSEDFESSSSVPASWTKGSALLSSVYSGGAISTGGSWGIKTTAQGLSANHLYNNVYGSSKRDWVITPNIYLNTNAQLSFDLALTAYSGSGAASTAGTDDKFVILVSTDNGATWSESNTLATWDNDGSSLVYNNIATNGEEVVIPLTAYTGQSVKIAFYVESTVSNADNNLHIDNVLIEGLSSCAKPTGVTANVLTSSSASISWTADSSQNYFEVSYGTSNNPEDSSMDTLSVSNASSVVLNNLDIETNYNVFVRALCGSTYSNWSNAAHIYIGYCQPSPTSVDNQGITNVTFGSEGEVVNNSQRPTTSPYYGNYYDQVGAIAAGTQADIDITYATGYTYGTIIWVDWNNNFTFDGNEVVYVGTSTSTNPTTITASFIVPATQDTGVYRMRIAGADSYYDSYTSSIADAANANPCPSSTYTIVHDYSLHVIDMPSCLTPVNIAASNITTTSADISWTGTASRYVVAYGTGTNPDSMSTTNVTTNSATISGLTATTTYHLFVKALCSSSEESAWSNMYTFNSACGFINLPYTQGFEGLTAGSGSDLPFCWNRINDATSSSYQSYPYIYANSSTTYSHAGVNCLYFYQSTSTSYPTYQMAVLPQLDATVNAPDEVRLSFWAKKSSSSYDGYLHIGMMTDPTDYSTFSLVDSVSLSTTYNYYTVPFNNYRGRGTYVAISCPRSNASSSYQSIYLDDVMLEELPSCIEPQHVTVLDTTITATAATVVWNADSSQSNFVVAYGTSNDISTMDTMALSCTCFKANLTGLTPSSTYYVYVKASCLPTEQSPWSQVCIFSTACQAIALNAGDSLTQDFENGMVCWTMESMNTENEDRLGIFSESSSIHSGSYGFRLSSYSSAIDYNQYLYSPEIISTDSMSISLWHKVYGTSDSLWIGYSTTGNSPSDFTAWTTLPSTTSWQQFTDAVPANVKYIAVRYWGDYAYYGYIDDIVIRSLGTAPIVTPTHTVSVTSSNPIMGTVTGSGTYDEGDTVTITATAAANCRFMQWNDGDTHAVRSIIVMSDTSFTATFAYRPVHVALTVSDTAMGTTIPAPGSYTFQVGDTMAAMAVARSGYHFVNWHISYGILSDSTTTNPAAMVIPALMAGANISVTANFAQDVVIPDTYTITVTSNNTTMGTVTGGGTYTEGSTATLTATAATNCHFVQWNDGDTHAVRTITVTSNATYTATFAYNPLTVTLAINNSAMGNTTPAAGTYTFNVGDTMTATATPATGHHFVNWAVAAGVYSYTDTHSVITEVVPVELAGQSITVTANFAVNQYTITAVSNNDAMGTVTGGGTYNYGATATLTATAAAHHHFVQWNDGDTHAVRTVTVTNDASYTATFAIDMHTLTVTANDDEMGSVEGTGTYAYGTEVEISATANEGFYFAQWNDGDTNATRNIILTADMSFEAQFAPIEQPEAELYVVVNDSTMGYVLINGEAADSYFGHIGDVVTLTAVPTDASYRFIGWEGIDQSLVGDTVTFTLTTESIIVYANFEYTSIGIDNVEADDVILYSERNRIIVRGAEQQTIRIFDAVGRLVAQRDHVEAEETISMPTTGIYLVQIGNKPARRVVVRK